MPPYAHAWLRGKPSPTTRRPRPNLPHPSLPMQAALLTPLPLPAYRLHTMAQLHFLHVHSHVPGQATWREGGWANRQTDGMPAPLTCAAYIRTSFGSVCHFAQHQTRNEQKSISSRVTHNAHHRKRASRRATYRKQTRLRIISCGAILPPPHRVYWATAAALAYRRASCLSRIAAYQ